MKSKNIVAVNFEIFTKKVRLWFKEFYGLFICGKFGVVDIGDLIRFIIL
jgi:hypothetical protein